MKIEKKRIGIIWNNRRIEEKEVERGEPVIWASPEREAARDQTFHATLIIYL